MTVFSTKNMGRLPLMLDLIQMNILSFRLLICFLFFAWPGVLVKIVLVLLFPVSRLRFVKDKINVAIAFWWVTPRLKTIGYALWFGILPWQWYEAACHYKSMTYKDHLIINMLYAWRWLTYRETEADIAFEQRVNGYNSKFKISK